VILDTLQRASRYEALHPLFPLAFRTLAGEHIASLPAGKHAVRGDDLTLIVARDEGKGKGGAVLESHRRFIDVQMVIAGTDLIGWRPAADCRNVLRPYDAEKDLALYGDAPLVWCAIAGPLFALYFPEDAHAPLGGEGTLHKAVMKISV